MRLSPDGTKKTGANVTAPYTIAGLGEWLESTLNSSRTLYFNPDH